VAIFHSYGIVYQRVNIFKYPSKFDPVDFFLLQKLGEFPASIAFTGRGFSESGSLAKSMKSNDSASYIYRYGGFRKWGYPNWMVYNGKSIYKWMRTGGIRILGNLHIPSYE